MKRLNEGNFEWAVACVYEITGPWVAGPCGLAAPQLFAAQGAVLERSPALYLILLCRLCIVFGKQSTQIFVKYRTFPL